MEQEKARLRQIRKEIEKKRKETIRRKREEEAKRREEITRRKLEGQLVIPQLYLGTRLSAQNWHWLRDAQKEHNLYYVLNVSNTIPNYYESGANEAFDFQDGLEELEELLETDDPKQVESEDQPEDSGQDSGEHVEKNIEEWKEDEDLFENLEGLDDMKKLEILEKLDVDDKEAECEGEIDIEEPDEKENNNIIERARQQMKKEDNVELTLSYKKIPIEDSYEEDISAYFDEGVQFIKDAIEKGNSVLVHCREGRSRSVTMIVAYLIIEKKWSLLAAYEHMSAISPDININNGFKKQLVDLDKKVHNKISLDFFDRSTRVQTRVNYKDECASTVRRERKPPVNKKTKDDEPKLKVVFNKTDIYDTSDIPQTDGSDEVKSEDKIAKPKNILEFFGSKNTK